MRWLGLIVYLFAWGYVLAQPFVSGPAVLVLLAAAPAMLWRFLPGDLLGGDLDEEG